MNSVSVKGNIGLKISFLFLVFIFYFYKVYQVTTRAEPATNTYDSPSYLNFEFFPAFRMQLITIPYFLISDPERIVVFQTIISAVSWLILALAIIHFFDYSLVSIGSLPFIFILASSSVVLEHNYILASESLNNSAIVFLIAATLYYFKTKSILALLFISMALVMVAGTKSAAAMAIFAVGVGFFVILLLDRKNEVKVLLITSTSFLLIAFFAATALSSDITKTLTTSGTINNRIWIDDNWRDQILKSGYPPDAREIWEAYSLENLGSPPDQAVVDSPGFNTWWENGGENFLNAFMFRNLDYTLVGPFCLPCLNANFKFEKTLVAGWGVGTNEIRIYSVFGDIGLSRTFFWPVKPEDSYLAIGLIAVVIAISLLISIFSKNYLAGVLSNSYTILLSFVIGYSLLSWWFGSKPVDMTRHQLAGALTLRILAIISTVYVLTTFYNFAKFRLVKKSNEK